MSEPAAAPACCPPGSHGASDGPAKEALRGDTVRLTSSLGELNAYVSLPPEGAEVKEGECLVFLHDIFGVDSGRTKTICDEYAAKGYAVILPDLAKNGTPSGEDLESKWKITLITLVPSLISYIWKNRRTSVLTRLNEAVLPYVRDQLGAKKIALMCYCWGCYPMVHLLGEHHADIRCAVGFHPSLQPARINWEDRATQLAAIDVPIMFLSAKNDPSDIKPGGMAHKVMQKKPFADDCAFKLYEKMVHGWVNRGDLDDAEIAADYADAVQLADDFLAKHL